VDYLSTFYLTATGFSPSIQVAPTWSIGHPWKRFVSLQFLNLRESVGLPGQGDQPVSSCRG
jgi:hypothetical protein